MSIKLGNSNITLKVGDSAVTAAYLGTTLVYTGGTPPTPPTFQGKYLATFSDGHTESAVCDASSAMSAVYGDLVSLQIGDCVTGTSGWFCNNQTGLTSVDLGNSLMSIANGSFMGTAITAITIPNTVTSIGSQAFQECSNLTSVIIPSGVTSIGNNAFTYCVSLTSVTIGSDVTSINNGAFQNCRALTSITIPNSVTSIGDFAFMGCNSLSAITFESTYPPTLGRDAIDGYSAVIIYVPCDSLEYYKSAWTDLSNKIQCDSPTPPTPTSYTYSVTITGLENGDTTNIRWNYGDHIDHNVGNGTYTYTTTANTITVDIDTSGLSDYTVDHDRFTLYSGGSQVVTFTYQGGGGGLVQIPYGADMPQYYGQSIKRLVIGDTSTTNTTNINYQVSNDYLSISQWTVWGVGQFASVHSLPIDITLSTPVQFISWTNGYESSDNRNLFNDLQIEWA